MQVLATIAGVLLIAIILLDAFETVILPRRVTRQLRLTRLFFRATWRCVLVTARGLEGSDASEGSSRRDRLLGVYGPLALLMLLAVWAAGLVLGFALLKWGSGTTMIGPEGRAGFGTFLYESGVTFFTIGFGDVTARDGLGRALTVAEGATGFSFLALVIGYLPVIYGAFSEREAEITLLDAQAGSPPTTIELLRRLSGPGAGTALDAFLRDWERWTARLLESHLSYFVLSYYRSQHERQSWLAALTVVLDTCALVIVGIGDGPTCLPERQARLTFALARHAVGDLSQVINAVPGSTPDRLSQPDLARVREVLAEAGLPLRGGTAADRQLAALRSLYEPYVTALADRLLFALPPWLPAPDAVDDWQTTAWQHDPQQAVTAMERGAFNEEN